MSTELKPSIAPHGDDRHQQVHQANLSKWAMRARPAISETINTHGIPKPNMPCRLLRGHAQIPERNLPPRRE